MVTYLVLKAFKTLKTANKCAGSDGTHFLLTYKKQSTTVCGPVSGHKRRKLVFRTSEGLQSAEINTKSIASVFKKQV